MKSLILTLMFMAPLLGHAQDGDYEISPAAARAMQNLANQWSQPQPQEASRGHDRGAGSRQMYRMPASNQQRCTQTPRYSFNGTLMSIETVCE